MSICRGTCVDDLALKQLLTNTKVMFIFWEKRTKAIGQETIVVPVFYFSNRVMGSYRFLKNYLCKYHIFLLCMIYIIY